MVNLRRHLRPPMTILSVDADARRASACTVTRESTTDSKRDPSFVGSLHILCHTRLSERWGTLKPTCVPTNHLISLDYSGSGMWRHRYSLTLHIHQESPVYNSVLEYQTTNVVAGNIVIPSWNIKQQMLLRAILVLDN